ncbi:hypothetical protein [Streptomyces sp. NPDC005890]|uniref:hypothetical protein n=1 Tax=Streptomyces sp. NPDC005890 TaxID=3154568 RepID=UPI0033E563DC
MSRSGASRARARVAAGLPRYTEEEAQLRRQQARVRADRAKEQLTAELTALKLQRGCADCGYRAHAEALDFDHLPGAVKIAGVTRMVSERRSRDAVMAEVAKCEVVCANCHRVRTATRRVPLQNAEAAPLSR